MTHAIPQMEYEGGDYEIDVDVLPVVSDPEASVRLSADDGAEGRLVRTSREAS